MSLKKEQRRFLLARRKALSEQYRKEASERICRHVAKSDAWQKADTVFAYCPVGEEVDLTALWECALGQGRRIAFPRCVNGEMVFLQVQSLSELVPDAYGIPAPKAFAQEVLPTLDTLCIVPALSVDEKGYRMGYGGGYYDRFLAKHETLFTLCAVYAQMQVGDVCREECDRRVKAFVNENGVCLL